MWASGPEARCGDHEALCPIQPRAGADGESLPDQAPGHIEGLVVGDLELDQRIGLEGGIDRREAVGHAGNPAAEQRAALGTAECRARHGPCGEGGDVAAEVGESLAKADERAAGPHAADDRIDASPRDLHDDLLGRLMPVGAGVVGIRELERKEAPALGRLARGAEHGTANSLGTRRENHLASIRLDDQPTFLAYSLGYHGDEAEIHLRRSQRHGNARRAARCLDHRPARPYLPAAQRLARDVIGNPVLGRATRVEELQLTPDDRARGVELHGNQRSRRRAVEISIDLGKSRAGVHAHD